MIQRFIVCLSCLLVVTQFSMAADPPKPAGPDLSEYKSVETAIASRISLSIPGRGDQVGYLGVRVAADERGRLVVAEMQLDSPAAKSGLLVGDVVSQVDGQPVAKADVFRERLQTKAPGETVKLAVVRGDKPLELSATLIASSRPMKFSGQTLALGVQLGDPKEGEGPPIERITPNSAAEKAGLKVGDLILKLDGTALANAAGLTTTLSTKKAGDVLAMLIRRDGKEVELKVELSADRGRDPRFGGRDGGTPPTPWKKDLYRLGVVCVEFPDVKHNAKVYAKDWQEALFSQGTFAKKENATGQTVHGSLNDYFQEQSYGAFRIEGKVFDWIEVGKKRSQYSEGSGTGNKEVLLVEAVDKLLARDGKEALKDFDGLFFVYAGEAVRTNRGALYYPHASSFNHQRNRVSYMLAPEGGSKMTPISTFCREFAFLLNLPDLAARTENAGSEGCGVWCALSEPLGDGRPQHLCAWSKETIGWIQPTAIDPTVKQKLILKPIEDSPKECFKVLVRPDGSEYLLLENRRKKGFDQNLPAEGLLIWRVVNGRPLLEESHGVEGAAGPRAFVDLVPYPSPANNSFTPATTPSSRSPKGGGLPVSITEIRRLADGRISFHIGYDLQ